MRRCAEIWLLLPRAAASIALAMGICSSGWAGVATVQFEGVVTEGVHFPGGGATPSDDFGMLPPISVWRLILRHCRL